MNMNRNNSDDIYFYCSPIGVLEIQFKEDQLYSLSKMRSLNSFKKLYSKNLLSVYSFPYLKQKKVRDFSFFKKHLKSLKTQTAVTTEPCLYVFKKKGKQALPQSVRQLAVQLKNYFSGKKVKIWKVSLYSRGTVFQNEVWRELSRIPYGCTQTYSKTAQNIQSPKAVRAVGSACGCNPWLLIVPCHRVVSQKGLGGFALGLKVKTFLLQHENSSHSCASGNLQQRMYHT